MKQLHTIENQMMHVADSIACRKAFDNRLPGKHIINNILNYSRSLEVFKLKRGKPVMILGN